MGDMRRNGWVFCLVFLLILAPLRVAVGQTAPILDAARVLGLPASTNADLERFLRLNTPRAFAVGSNGAMGWQAGGGAMRLLSRKGPWPVVKDALAPAIVLLRCVILQLFGQVGNGRLPRRRPISASPLWRTIRYRIIASSGGGSNKRVGFWYSPMAGVHAAIWMITAAPNHKAGHGTSTMLVMMFGALTASPIPMKRRGQRVG